MEEKFFSIAESREFFVIRENVIQKTCIHSKREILGYDAQKISQKH